ncbi:MAG: bL28 family ribosomal protein [Patescibacteria group bacterium]|nr:50S ribosomal protein L28 [Patescibacteria group bacterium]MBU1684444.1 50S ribosomal protein L28 [Patescibacteria group bacterium]MBU1987325.1 50S ribosomal protein L28 [Patescibacteria group bacterium]MBU2456308.1 50S ribosomal protein L28 [Patescibacteria group bacterium]MBU2474612.1 50S ribosomal protein L28 [Patescibacteria group bacterium]
MSKQCNLCKRSTTKGAIRSHSNIKTIKRQNINLQSKKIDGKKLKICVNCLRSLKQSFNEVANKSIIN